MASMIFFSAIHDTDAADLNIESKRLAMDIAQRAYDLKVKGAHSTPTSNVHQVRSPAEGSIKRDVTHYNKITKLAVYFQWYESFKKVARAQGLENILDPTYTPQPGTQEEELFIEQQKYMDYVLDATFQCAEAKQILNEQRDTGLDAQKALAKLHSIACQSSAAKVRLTQLLADLQRMNWKNNKLPGGARGYVTHINDVLQEHNDIAHFANLQLPENAKKIRMQQAVAGLPELNNVELLESMEVARDPSKETTYQQYLNLLLDAADR